MRHSVHWYAFKYTAYIIAQTFPIYSNIHFLPLVHFIHSLSTFPVMCFCRSLCSVASVVSDSLRPNGLYPARLLCPWDSPGKNTGVGCHALLQGIFLTQGSNPGLLHCRQILYTIGEAQGQHGSNLNVYQQRNGSRRCGTYMQWNIIQP